VKASRLGWGVLAALVVSIAAPATQPPAPGGAKRALTEGHAKPSSFAPQPRAPHRAYGAPVQRQILSKQKRRKHRAANPPPKSP
jgi:hypothetical protein